ncbi:MAG: tetratricopeptide repeat protein [Verrucomicrobiae bacterium]|nr:tetratricopeptide repeat protein [Verrucomicrobiae bacterium]
MSRPSNRNRNRGAQRDPGKVRDGLRDGLMRRGGGAGRAGALAQWVGLAALILVAVGVTTWFVNRRSSPEPAGRLDGAVGEMVSKGPVLPGLGSRVEEPIPEPLAEAAALKGEAVAVATALAAAYPEDALAHAVLGSACYNLGRTEEAGKHLRRCLELNPGLVDAYEILARMAYEQGNLEETLELCRQALNRGPANAELLNRMGRALMDLGQAEDAMGPLRQAVSLPRPTSESHYLLGQAHVQSGEYEAAINSFLEAVRLLPDHTQAYFGLYTASLRLERADEADRYRRRFQELEAEDRQGLSDRSAREDTLTGLPLVRRTVAQTLFGAAQVYGLHGEPGRAGGLLLRAASLDPENAAYRGAMEGHHVRERTLTEGVAAFEGLVADQPGNPLNHYFLGRLLGRMEQFDAAERAYRRTLELAPDWAEGHRALAELLLRAGRPGSEARELARRVVTLEPSGPHHYLLAVACLRAGDRPGAREAIQRALAIHPDEARYRQFLEQLSGVARP